MNNKIILVLIVAVCVLGMALIMLNERVDHKNTAPSVAEPAPVTGQAPASAQPELNRDSFAAPDPQDLPPAATPPLPSAAPKEHSKEHSADVSTLPAHDLQEGQPQSPVAASLTPDKPVSVDSGALHPRLDEQNLLSATAAQETAAQDHPAPVSAADRQAEIDRKIKAQDEARAAAAKQDTPARKEEAAAPKENKKEEAAKEKPQAEAKTPAEPRITRFVVFARENGATVRMEGAMPMSYKSILLDNPHRMVIDLPGTWQVKAPGVPANALVSNVRIGHPEGRTRIVIDLKEKPGKHRLILSKNKKRLDFRVDR